MFVTDCSFQSGNDCKRETPVSIPNTEVKPLNADGTWVVTPWESRKLPGYYEILVELTMVSSTGYIFLGSSTVEQPAVNR